MQMKPKIQDVKHKHAILQRFLLLILAFCFIFPVIVYVTMMLKVAETVSGESLYEKKQVEMKLEKCLPVSS